MEEVSTAYISVFVVIVFTIIALTVVVILQRRKIKELETPSYGFLGKPLMVLAIGLLAAGTVGLFQITTDPETDTDISVSDIGEVSLEVFVTELSTVEDSYLLKATPYVNGLEWGGETFDVYWTVTDKRQQSESYVESGLSAENEGGITVTLPKGNVTVKAEIFIGDEVITKEIQLYVE